MKTGGNGVNPVVQDQRPGTRAELARSPEDVDENHAEEKHAECHHMPIVVIFEFHATGFGSTVVAGVPMAPASNGDEGSHSGILESHKLVL